ncbi:MAG: FtsX-like permease family protein [Planctomycetes bacterium]|nr:FtsX-like permease family protein [Planctomycetota bacterium]
MAAKIGKALLLALGILMILSVTVFDPADITEKAKRLFGLTSGQRADRDIEGVALTSGREVAEEAENQRIRDLAEELKIADTRETVRFLSTLPHSRAVGYPGNALAADYVEDAFRSIGLDDVRVQTFDVAVPVDEGGTMEVQGLDRTIELSCLWPNEVQTSSLPAGFEGTLVDGGNGAFRALNGFRLTREVKVTEKVGKAEVQTTRDEADAVVLLDFNCGQNWLNPCMLGAKAVVFFDNGGSHLHFAHGGNAPNEDVTPSGPPAVTRGEAEQKLLAVPANLPRFWVSREDGLYLRAELRKAANAGKELRTKMQARMAWRRVRARNIIGVIPGTLPPEPPSEKVDYQRQRTIVLSAFFDAASVVPRVAPGAENACGLAALLQTARVLKKFPPRHTVVFLATGCHFHCLWGAQEFLRQNLPTSSELGRTKLPKGRVDFDLFVGLDLTSHNNQVATTCFGTFYNRWWEMNVYRKNLLAPYAKNFTEYAARVFRKSTSEATCPHINAITPPKKTWKNFVPRPVAFDSEGVEARGKDAVTLFTPNEIRNLVDTPNDTLERLDVEKLHTQVKTVAALIAKAGRDIKFFTDSKLRLQNRINYTQGNATWFDRGLNPNIPKAPLGGAVVTFRHFHAAMTNAGVRTLYTAYAQDRNPCGGDHKEGFYIDPVTLNSRRVTLNVWSDRIGGLQDAEAVVQSRGWLRTHTPRRAATGKGATATIRVAERFVHEEEGKARHAGEPLVSLPIAGAEPLRGWWEAAPAEIGKRSGRFIPPEEDAPANLPREGHAHIQVGNARYRGPILVPPDRFELDVDLDPPGWLGRLFRGGAITEVKLPADAPDVDPNLRVLRSLTLRGTTGTYEAKDVNVAFGQFEGQYYFPFILEWRWGDVPVMAYKMDDDGLIAYAQDEGAQGKQTYPNAAKYGGGTQCVLFRCKPLTILEIVDSRYLTVLDMLGVLGTDNSEPQQWGARYVPGQSRQEGLITSAAVVFGKYEPQTGDEQRLKIHMGTGLFGIKLLLTNAELEREGRIVARPPEGRAADLGITLKEARGAGYPVTGRSLLFPTYRVAWDMWVLNDYRLREMERYGISNPMLANFPKQGQAGPPPGEPGLHDRAREALVEADKARRNLDHERFIAESRRAWGYEAKAYPEVSAQADDTVKGVVFYFILLIPFAFFMERLLVGAADIRKRIAGFAIIFLVVFMILRYVHPAFKLSTSPYIILLAFVILAMGVIVLFIVVGKFNEQIRKMKQAATGIQQADVGRLSASYAAIMLGISNLRKRRVRTGLTAVTLTLLTFTVLSFTSIQTSLYIFELSRANKPSYEGALVRDRNWRGLQDIVLDYLRSEFSATATIAPRAWLLAKTRGEKEFFEFASAGGRSNVNGIVGLTPEEVYVNPTTGPQSFLLPGSRWFREGDRYACILPDDVAGRVGIKPEAIKGKTDAEKPRILMLGHEFTVIGLLNSEQFNKYRDLDDEKLTPVDTQQEGARMQVEENPDEAAKAPIQAFTHIESSNSMLVPYQLARDIGGTLNSIALSTYKGRPAADGAIAPQVYATKPFKEFSGDIRRFMQRVAMNLFIAQGTGEDARVRVWSSLQTTSFGGVGNLFVPILIAALIVLNTMMGAVYERFREIYIYSSVGLAPTHVAALFLAESAVYATVGAVAGYLLGQLVANIVFHLGLLGTITLNYSSLSAIYSSLVVMITVFLSSLYPAKKASDMAVPDVTRRWEFPPPEGDRWQFDFPFTVGGAEILGMYCYLARFLQSYGETSIGAFYTEDVTLAKGEPGGKADYVISARCWLAPYDLGISQDVRFEAVPTGEFNIYRIEVLIHRVSGDTLSWQRMNRGFLNVLRKQFLVWRTVPSGTKAEYAEEGTRLVGEAVPAPAPAV